MKQTDLNIKIIVAAKVIILKVMSFTLVTHYSLLLILYINWKNYFIVFPCILNPDFIFMTLMFR